MGSASRAPYPPAVAMAADETFTDELERWLRADEPKTLG
jgi:hypothetical protein